MELSIYEAALKNYLEAISPSATQKSNMDERYVDLATVIVQSYPEATIYPQGSFATDTQVKPLTKHQGNGHAGEYDIDLAVERKWAGATASLEDVEAVIKESGEYDSFDIDGSKSKCVRIKFPEDSAGVSFHLDIVPTKVIGNRHVPVREEDTWEQSNAKKFADWFNDKANEEPNLRSAAVILKRLRDLAGVRDDISSILMLTLVSNHYYANDSLMQDLVKVLQGATSLFSSENPPAVANPVNVGEDLMDNVDDYAVVRAFFKDTYSMLQEALADEDGDQLEDIFGPGFKHQKQSNSASASSASTATALAAQPRAYGATIGQINP